MKGSGKGEWMGGGVRRGGVRKKERGKGVGGVRLAYDSVKARGEETKGRERAR